MSEKLVSVQLVPFEFDNQQVRVIQGENGEPMFVVRDIASALEYTDASMSNLSRIVAHVPKEWKGRNPIPTPGGNQHVLTLTEQGLYFFVARSDKPKAQPFQKWLAGEVLPAIRQTGGYQLPATKPAEKYNQDHNQGRLTGELALLECFCTLNNPAPSSRVVLLEKIGSAHGLNTDWLPGYVEDGPEAGQGSLPTASATDLLSEFGVPLTAAAFNKQLHAIGILERCTRRSRNGPKQFWCITDTGEAFGKNLTSPQSPRETQPHWYRGRFVELLAMIGMKGVA
ncbi:BRO-N domain-containing protein [Vreelandella alkaliphila]|uniref:BRO-N domain-containing protein n=1 Tax=Vreelandella alkaliphila TaxID=272774 RepID=UPI003FD7EE08